MCVFRNVGKLSTDAPHLVPRLVLNVRGLRKMAEDLQNDFHETFDYQSWCEFLDQEEEDQEKRCKTCVDLMQQFQCSILLLLFDVCSGEDTQKQRGV